jgi:hypothetical protein
MDSPLVSDPSARHQSGRGPCEALSLRTIRSRQDAYDVSFCCRDCPGEVAEPGDDSSPGGGDNDRVSGFAFYPRVLDTLLF